MKKLIKPIEIGLAVVAALVGLVYGFKRFAMRIEVALADRGSDVVEDEISPIVMPLPPEVPSASES